MWSQPRAIPLAGARKRPCAPALRTHDRFSALMPGSRNGSWHCLSHCCFASGLLFYSCGRAHGGCKGVGPTAAPVGTDLGYAALRLPANLLCFRRTTVRTLSHDCGGAGYVGTSLPTRRQKVCDSSEGWLGSHHCSPWGLAGALLSECELSKQVALAACTRKTPHTANADMLGHPCEGGSGEARYRPLSNASVITPWPTSRA